MQTLLVENEVPLAKSTMNYLSHNGHQVDWRDNRIAAQALLDLKHFDLVLVALTLPHCAGLALVQYLRQAEMMVPVIVIGHRGGPTTPNHCLEEGADSVMMKPFSVEELNVRIHNVLWRTTRRKKIVHHRAIELDPNDYSVTVNGQPIALCRREFALLRTLLEKQGQVVSRTQLIQAIGAGAQAFDGNSIGVHIHHLRQKLYPNAIKTLYGEGYLIEKE